MNSLNLTKIRINNKPTEIDIKIETKTFSENEEERTYKIYCP